MLGAAREFMLENSVSLNHKDILDTIELCRRELFKKSATPSSSVGDSSEKESRLQKNFTSNWSADSSSNDNERSKNQNNENRKNYQKGQIDDSGNRNKRHQHKKNLLNREGNNDKLTTTKENNSKFDGTKKEFKKLSDCMVNRVRLKKTEQLVKIVYIESNNDKEKYWVNLVDNQEIMLNIMESCSKHADVAPLVTEPILGKMYMAMSIEDDLWYRVVVQKIKPFIQVHYIDFGNDAIVSQVRQLPDFLRILPAQAVRITLSRLEGESPPMLKMDGIVSVKFVKWFADGTCVVKTTPSKGSSNDSTNFHKQSTKSVANLEPIFTDRIKYTTELMDKEQIKIIAHSEGRFYLRNKEHHCKLMDINNLIEGFPSKLKCNIAVNYKQLIFLIENFFC
ncbi:hypothetical protein HHI36_003534 [Cryptolaemus montrouzieri]|uniref:Tudor domain-containing protein n=1 Tax=Cryptolaemus montrouzieri TaxID=559131 RepID=A0ABD2PEE7_9CUCU